jgi:hypothetical protein
VIDYALAKKQGPKIKAALTRAKNIANPKERYSAVLAACHMAVKAWEQWGAWPDAWTTWQIALDDAAHKHNMSLHWPDGVPVIAPRLEAL